MASSRSTSHRRVRFDNSRPQVGPAGFISDTSEGAIADRDTTDADTDWTDCEALKPSIAGPSQSHTRITTDPSRPVSAGRASGKRSSRNGRSSPNTTPEPSIVKRRKDESSDVSELEGAVGLRFACPYFKHDPQTYRTHRTCPGPGWLTVHRVKEHLYRRHSQQPFCPRCFQPFVKEADLSLHLRLNPCPVLNDGKIPPGLSSMQKDQLKKRLLPGQTEDERWREVYRIAFPNDVAIPSPYLDEANATDPTCFRHDLLRRIRHELLDGSTDYVDGREEQFMKRVADIILKCENELQQNTMPAPSLEGSLTAPQPLHPGLDHRWSYLTEEDSDSPSREGRLSAQLDFAELALNSDPRPALTLDPALPQDYANTEPGPQTPVDWIQLVNYPDWISTTTK